MFTDFTVSFLPAKGQLSASGVHPGRGDSLFFLALQLTSPGKTLNSLLPIDAFFVMKSMGSDDFQWVHGLVKSQHNFGVKK